MRRHEITLDLNSFVFVSTIVGYIGENLLGHIPDELTSSMGENIYTKHISQEREIRVLIY